MSKKVEASPDAELAVFVRNARARLGLSGTELGETVGRTRGNISHWEQGLHEPPYTILRKLSEMSGIPLPGINSDWPFKTITSEEFFKPVQPATCPACQLAPNRKLSSLRALTP